jgi:hypothetical protein
MDGMRAESEAILAEVHRRVNTWKAEGMDEDERKKFRAVVTALAKHQPPRYRRRGGDQGIWWE